MYVAEKAYFAVTLMVWIISGIYLYYDSYVETVPKGKRKKIPKDLMPSIWSYDVRNYQEPVNRRACMEVRLIE